MTLQEIKTKYQNVPTELQEMKRWVCFKVEGMEDGRKTKRPYNAMTGKFAKVNDELTWATFKIALTGCIKFDCDGIGFVLGNGIFGIDIDNHESQDGNRPLTDEEFTSLCTEFIETLDSYTEVSQSGNGIHIICSGKLPEGSRRKGSVEMYDKGRFFAFTGNAIRNIPIQNREEEVKPLWKKYIYTEETQPVKKLTDPSRCELKLSDEEVIEAALNSHSSDTFYRYYHDGDLSMNNNDQSSADMSFCNLLAFWCNGDILQMDRIFRNSALMRDKWDKYRGDKTYGEITLESAIKKMTTGYVRTIPKYSVNVKDKSIQGYAVTEDNQVLENYDTLMNIDENGEPIFKIKKINKKYTYNDTGNALRFYDQFGEFFKYNVTDKIFMFWTGKTWVRDTTSIIRKYANKLIDILKEEEKAIEEQIAKLIDEGKTEESKLQQKILDACIKNVTRVSNKAGKDAMLSELQSLYDVSVESSVFNQDDYLLNTDTGIIDLKTGEILPFDKNRLISKNTNTEVSYEEPTVWLKFLQSVFNNGNMVETQEMIDALQICLGYSLTGTTKEQVMFILYGGGSNGKSTLTETISKILGDYADNVSSDILMQQKSGGNNSTFSIAKLQTTRFVETGETDDGGKLSERTVKLLTGEDKVAAQFKFGQEFSFKPKFKIWMSTNNKPIIRGTDFGIWRRIFIFPFLNRFTGAQKDKDLPEKLKKEAPQILGWCIQGYLKYQERGEFIKPKAIEDAIKDYQDQMDVITQFIKQECVLSPEAQVECKTFYSAYKEWSNNNTEYTMKESQFRTELKSKENITIKKGTNESNYYKGVRLASFNIRG